MESTMMELKKKVSTGIHGQIHTKVIQRRLDGSIDFYRDWSDYKKGFGNVSGEYWLGNDNIFNILNGKSYSLRFDVQDWSGEWRYAQYKIFKLADESKGYEITLDGYTGNAGDAMLGSLKYLTDTRFSTKDHDNDDMPTAKCTDHTNGGWWYQGLPGRWCTKVNPNGRYFGDASTTSTPLSKVNGGFSAYQNVQSHYILLAAAFFTGYR
ncbi:ficolin-2-like [Mytilus trossulus]|uniref:ficolin-2-like n=1 Tax=Mytilus trossulus TaxID=6551 RepID=UPI003005082C